MESLLQDRQLISLFIDAILIAALFALWFIWYRNGKRQQRLEKFLIDTANQLDQATMHLNQATQLIEQLKQRSAEQEHRDAAAPEESRHRQSNIPEVQEPPSENSAQATMVLRMHREGEDAESIADRLNIPLGQVKLLLKLYGSKHAA